MKQILTNLEDLQAYITYELELENLTQEFMDEHANLFSSISQEEFLQECENEIKEIYRDVQSLEARIGELIKDYSFKRAIKSISSLVHHSRGEALVKDMICSFSSGFYEHCMFYEKRRISKSEFIRDHLRSFLSEDYIQSTFAQGINTSMEIMDNHDPLHSASYLDKMSRHLAEYYYSENKEEAKTVVDLAIADLDISNNEKNFSPFTEQLRKKLFLFEQGCQLFVPDKWKEVKEDAEAVKEDVANKTETEKQIDAMCFPWEGKTTMGEMLGKHHVKKAQEICEKYILKGLNAYDEKVAALLYVSNLNHLKEARKNNKRERGLFWASVKSIATSATQVSQVAKQFGSDDMKIDEDWLALNFLECISRDLYDFDKISRQIETIDEDGWSSVTTDLFEFDIIYDLALSDISCRESYQWIKEMHEMNDLKLVGLTKKELYRAQILTAVLLNIDKPHIKSIIEDIILQIEGIEYISEGIEERIEIESAHFAANDINNHTNPSQTLMHNSAVNFLIFYLHNPMHLLPISSYPTLYFSDMTASLFAETRSQGIKFIIEDTYDIINMSEKEKQEVIRQIDDSEMLNQIVELIQTVEDILTKFHEEKLEIKDKNHPFTIISYAKGENKNWNRITEKFLVPDFITQVASVIWLDGLFGSSNDWIKTFLDKTEEEKANYIVQRAHDIFLFNEIDELGDFISDADLNIFEEMDSADLEEKLFEMEQKLNEQSAYSISDAESQKQYKELIQPLKNQVKELANNYSALHSQNSKLLKSLEDQRKENEKLKEDQQELIKLRELMFGLGKTEIEREVEDVSKDLSSILEDKKIIIIGGHEKMLLELKQKYDSIISFTKETANIAPVIRNANHVFICYEWINHSLYYKAMDVIKTCGVQMDYIKGMNTKKTEAFIYEKLSQ